MTIVLRPIALMLEFLHLLSINLPALAASFPQLYLAVCFSIFQEQLHDPPKLQALRLSAKISRIICGESLNLNIGYLRIDNAKTYLRSHAKHAHSNFPLIQW